MDRHLRSKTNSTLARALVCSLVALGPASAAAPQGKETALARSRASDEPGVVTLEYGIDEYRALAEEHARGEPFSLLLPFSGGDDVRATLWPVNCLERHARARIVSSQESSWCEARARCFSGVLANGETIFLGCAPGQIHGYVSRGGELQFLTGGDSRGGIAKLARASRTKVHGTPVFQSRT